MCLGFFATFLKKGSAKNFFSKKVLGCFSKKVRSTVVVNRRAFFILSGYAVTILIPLRPSLPVGAYRPSLAVGTADHCRHLIRHLSVTPSPTGEGNCGALFRQQIYNASVCERLDLMKGSLV